MCCNCCSVRQQKIWVFGLGTFLVILGTVLLSAWPSLSRQLIRGMLPLAPNSFLYKSWVAAPVPVYSTFYLFNWTNPEDFNNTDVKPHYEQLGPYTFSDYKVKEDLFWQQPEVTFDARHFSPLTYHGPFYVSHPHFYMTDESYRENTTGLLPNAQEHSMHVVMEPTYGIPISLKGQVMLSAFVQRDEEIDHLKDIAYDHYAPMFMYQLYADLDDDHIRLLKLGLSVPRIGQFTGLGLLLIGLIVVIVGVIVTMKHKWHNEWKTEAVDDVKPLENKGVNSE
ncbi:GH23397 [Drosophila grimshawi]|uniref:GH23397 n=1 Tax=Drosophila grimshawi TaxID=7222 RepID=B4K301_DROGR|nr:GH23397 [Drosophila grimshawi]